MINRLFFTFIFLSVIFVACTKKDNPLPPVTITDTIIKVKTDTLTITDTVYYARCTDSMLKIGLLVYLPFNGSMADSSGNANPTTAVGGASLTYDEHGNNNSAYNGTGNGERIIVTNNGSIKFDTAFSISMNVMLRSNVLQTFASMVQTVNGHGVSFGLESGISGLQNVALAVADSSLLCSDEILISNSFIDTSNLALQPEAWYNIIAVFHKGTLQVYSNGILIGSKTGGTNTVPICASAQFIVGGWWDGGGQSVNGKLDEVRLYDKPLSAREISKLAHKFK